MGLYEEIDGNPKEVGDCENVKKKKKRNPVSSSISLVILLLKVEDVYRLVTITHPDHPNIPPIERTRNFGIGECETPPIMECVSVERVKEVNSGLAVEVWKGSSITPQLCTQFVLIDSQGVEIEQKMYTPSTLFILMNEEGVEIQPHEVGGVAIARIRGVDYDYESIVHSVSKGPFN